MVCQLSTSSIISLILPLLDQLKQKGNLFFPLYAPHAISVNWKNWFCWNAAETLLFQAFNSSVAYGITNDLHLCQAYG